MEYQITWRFKKFNINPGRTSSDMQYHSLLIIQFSGLEAEDFNINNGK